MRSFSTFRPFWCSECLRMQKWLEKMLVYFCTVENTRTCKFEGKTNITVSRKQRTKLTTSSNYFYYHVVILQLYSEILLFSTKKCMLICMFYFVCFGFLSPLIPSLCNWFFFFLSFFLQLSGRKTSTVSWSRDAFYRTHFEIVWALLRIFWVF